jgi:hypothetical protein
MHLLPTNLRTLALGLLLAAVSPSPTQAGANTWNNASGDSFWGGTSANWTSPSIWADGDDAIFGPSAAGIVYVPYPVQAHELRFNAPGYEIYALGGNITLSGTTPTITGNATANIATSLAGTSGLTVQAVSSQTNLILLGDSAGSMANTYSGGTYVRSGTLVLRAAGATTSGSSYGVDNIEAIDPGATVQIGTQFDGATFTRPPDGQVLRGNNLGRLNLTGGTFDNNGDDNGLNYPCPEGDGVVVNSSPYRRAVLKLQGGNTGKTYFFNGQIKDGGLNVTTPQGIAYQQNVDLNGNNFTLVLGGSNSFTGFLRLNSGTGNTVVLTNQGTLGYPTPINCPVRQILMNSGRIDLNGTSQRVGYVYTGSDANSVITNSAFGTLSTLTVCYNCTNLVAYNGAATPRGLRCTLRDDPATGGTLALTKEGVAIQPIGTYAGDGTPLPSNYHGDTTVNNGILQVLSVAAVSPNSAYRLNTTQGKLQLDYSGTATVRQLWLDGVQQTNGVYGAAQTTAITGGGTLTVTGYAAAPTLGIVQAGNTVTLSWSGIFKLQAKTNDVKGPWFDYPGGGSSPVAVPINPAHREVYFRLSE